MEGFEVIRRDMGEISTICVRGYLDAHTAPELETAFQKLVDEGRYRIVVNFEGLNYISSAGLGVFMGFIENIRDHQGDIKLTNMNPKIYRVFDLLGFPTLYEIFKDEKEAYDRFRSVK
ncbi:MAG: STAS domain-containing protein [candidate division KSB1 bacterium]|nr:STAS domain-containing protein [candidate division KSB1 bacterium]